MIKTEAGEKMKEENPIDGIDTIDGQELLRQELEKEGKKFGMPETPEMNMGGLMGDGMGVIIGIEAESGNEIPAGSKPEEVADDIPAMLSEGEYVVPADVVRWHGVKTFEGLRCEAKMGMGLMAQDGRIAEVDDEYEHGHDSPDYDIEEKDKPEVEEAEVEVVHAAEGVDLSPTEPTGGPYYGYRVVFDPEAGRYVFKAVDPQTQEYVTTTEYDPLKSTRYTPEALLGIGAEEEETEEEEEDGPTICPAGYVLQDGQCVPMTPVDMGGNEPSGPPDYVPYSEQLTTRIAESLGPLSPEDLADYEGVTLSDKAISRMTDARQPTLLQGAAALAGGVPGIIGLGVKNMYDSVGAKRAAITRENYLTGKVSGLTDTPVEKGKGIKAYNWTFNPNTASFNKTPATTEITAVQREAGGSSWVTDYNNVGASGTSYSREDVFSSDIDDPNSAINDVFAGIEADFASYSTVTGGGTGGQVTDYGTSYSPSVESSFSSTDVASYSASDGSDNDSQAGSGSGGQNDGTDSGSSAATASDNDTSDYSGYMNKGGYVTKITSLKWQQ